MEGFTWPITSIFYVENLVKSACCPTVLLCYCYLFITFQRWSLSQIMLILFPLLFSLVLQISPVKVARYQLPVLVFCGFGAACALSSLAHGRWYMKAFVGAAFIAILGFNIAGVYNTWKAITVDTRAEMANWIGRHLSPTAVLAQEGWDAIRHGVPSRPETGQVPVEVITVPRLISFGSVDGIRRAGVTHILLQQAIYGCHVDPAASVSINPSVRAFTLESRRFYQTLIREVPVVHYLPGKNPRGTFFSPALWLLCVVCDPPARPNIDVDFTSSCLT